MKPFTPEMFTDTKFDSKEDKAKFANHLIKFIEGGFKRTMFPKWFYRTLSNTFGNIAHYDIHGFYSEFFEDTEGKVRFIRQLLDYPGFGSPEYTYSDVEAEVRIYLKGTRCLQQWQQNLMDERVLSDLKTRDRLVAQYGLP